MTEIQNSTPTDCSYKDKIKWFNATDWYYWSSSEGSDDPGDAWNVYFGKGIGDYNVKYATLDVRAVLAF